MILLETLTYTTSKYSEPLTLALTPGETDLVEVYLDQLITPLKEKEILLPVHLKFLPAINVYSIEVRERKWNCQDGWRN